VEEIDLGEIFRDSSKGDSSDDEVEEKDEVREIQFAEISEIHRQIQGEEKEYSEHSDILVNSDDQGRKWIEALQNRKLPDNFKGSQFS
jgi:hypothetical protein